MKVTHAKLKFPYFRTLPCFSKFSGQRKLSATNAVNAVNVVNLVNVKAPFMFRECKYGVNVMIALYVIKTLRCYVEGKTCVVQGSREIQLSISEISDTFICLIFIYKLQKSYKLI